MKTLKTLVVILIFSIVSLSTFNNIVYTQGSGGNGSSGGGSSNTGGDNTGGDSSGSSNTGGNNTGGDNSGSSNGGNDSTGGDNTGGDSSGSSNTGGDNTGKNNSGSSNGGNHNNIGGDQIKNMYGEIVQLKARIGQESTDIGNKLMKHIHTSFGTLITEERINKYKKIIQNIDQIKSSNKNKIGLKDSIDYLKLKIEYKINVLNELLNLEKDMKQNEIKTINTFMYLIQTRYNENQDIEKKFKYERLIEACEKTQEKIKQKNYTDAQKKKAQNMLQYVKLKIFEELE